MQYIRHSLVALTPFVFGILLGLLAAPLESHAAPATPQPVHATAPTAR